MFSIFCNPAIVSYVYIIEREIWNRKDEANYHEKNHMFYSGNYLILSLSLISSVYADSQDLSKSITWEYTVYSDETMQNIVDKGEIPSSDTRYTWPGTTLKNGEVAVFSIAVGAAAAGYLFHSSLITEENSPLIGTEVQDPGDGILIYKDGAYRNKQGEIIDMEELQRKAEGIPENRIIEDIQDSSFIPSSVVEIPLETAKSAWDIPGVILTNASVAVLTKENGDSWMLSKGDSITCSFEKYPSETVSNQLLIVGYIKDGTLYPGDHFDMMTGTYTLTAEEDGKYFLYLLSASSDYLSIKAGEVTVQSS